MSHPKQNVLKKSKSGMRRKAVTIIAGAALAAGGTYAIEHSGSEGHHPQPEATRSLPSETMRSLPKDAQRLAQLAGKVIDREKRLNPDAVSVQRSSLPGNSSSSNAKSVTTVKVETPDYSLDVDYAGKLARPAKATAVHLQYTDPADYQYSFRINKIGSSPSANWEVGQEIGYSSSFDGRLYVVPSTIPAHQMQASLIAGEESGAAQTLKGLAAGNKPILPIKGPVPPGSIGA